MAATTTRRPVLLTSAAVALATPTIRRARAQTAAGPAAAAPQPSGPGFHRFRVGGFTVTMVHDGHIRRTSLTNPPLVRNATPEQIEAVLRESFLPTTHLDIPITVTFVETPRGLVAFDAGYGAGVVPTAGAAAGANMRAAGIDPERVVLVAVSHFHADHISGLTTGEGTLAFPNAEIAVPQAEWAYWMDEGEASRAPEARRPGFANSRRRLTPYLARLRRYEDGTELMPGIRARSAFGHTPGHSVFHVSDGAEQMMVLADLTNRPEINLRNSGWHFAGDQDPQPAEASRHRVLDRVAADRIRCTAYHWPFPANGYVAKEGEGYRFVPADWSSAG
jgi:glyoxylase-like metal-dependent hydrolase (beta-lactamase superfamily II)